MVRFKFGDVLLPKMVPATLLLDSVFYLVVTAQYVGFPLAAGLVMHEYGFFAFLLICFGICSLLCAIAWKKLAVARLAQILLVFTAFLFFALFIYLNGPFNVPAAIIFVTMLALNGISFTINTLMLANKGKRKQLARDDTFTFEPIDWTRTHPRAKTAVLLISIFGFMFVGMGIYTNWNQVISVRAPDGFTTTSSYWGPPARAVANAISIITPDDTLTLSVHNGTLLTPPAGFINGSLAYVTNVTYNNMSLNYCNYSAGAECYPNGTVRLSQPLPGVANITVTFTYVTNHKVFEYLNISQSTLIMNHHSTGRQILAEKNGYWYYNDNLFESIQDTYLYLILDYWGVKYYLNVHNGIDFPHVFNYKISVPLCYDVLDWFALQRSRGICTHFQGISPDFESGDYDKLWWTNYTSCAEPLFPGSLLPDIISESEWYDHNSQNATLYAEATKAWEEVYDYASSLGYTSYIVFGGSTMMDVIDGDLDTTRLPMFPTPDNPDVRFGIMSYMDAQDNIKGGRYHQYKDCINQIAVYGDRGRSILTGWIAQGTSWYTDDELGLGRYIEDILVAQAAGMNEIFHAPIYRLQGKWGDDAILTVHQALNEWPKTTIRFAIPAWEYRSNYMDAIKNFNHWWLSIPTLALIVGMVLFKCGVISFHTNGRSRRDA
nr:hypothetical protein [Candidatus Sigynarchaeota archaeon]